MRKILSDKTIWIIACLLFLAGILLPMFTLHKFLMFNERFSLLGGIIQLLKTKEWFLFFVISMFSIAAPIYKLHIIGVLIRKNDLCENVKTKIVKQLSVISKWSMADVFVVAVIVSTVKLGIMAGVSVHIGIVVFGISVLLTMWLVQRQMSQYEFRPKTEPS
jgi:paraquat-inducible protein A